MNHRWTPFSGLNAGSLAGNIFINNILNAVMEIISRLLTPYLMGKWPDQNPKLYVCNLEWKLMGRRKSLCLCFFILSASCIIAMLCKHFSGCIPDETDCGVSEIPQNCNSAMLNASKYLAFVGKFAVGSCFSILYTYSAELYPTCVRSSAVGFCSSMARVGGALSPLIFGIDATIPWFSNTVFGTLSFIGKISL